MLSWRNVFVASNKQKALFCWCLQMDWCSIQAEFLPCPIVLGEGSRSPTTLTMIKHMRERMTVKIVRSCPHYLMKHAKPLEVLQIFCYVYVLKMMFAFPCWCLSLFFKKVLGTPVSRYAPKFKSLYPATVRSINNSLTINLDHN